MNNVMLVQQFIDQIWNKNEFGRLDDFLHPEFKDHSLPGPLPGNKEGLRQWITGTGISFRHNTVIEEQVTEGNKSIIKIRMNLKHIGAWRNIAATGKDLYTIGYRYFRLKDGRIIEHWALIDGQALENQIRDTAHGCKIAE